MPSTAISLESGGREKSKFMFWSKKKIKGKVALLVDFGYAYDYLSILFVKLEKTNRSDIRDQYFDCFVNLCREVGDEFHGDVMFSDEYNNLVEVNRRLYDLVDLAKKDEVKASEVDMEVYQRFLAKKALQEKFFPNAAFSERKIGYAKAI